MQFKLYNLWIRSDIHSLQKYSLGWVRQRFSGNHLRSYTFIKTLKNAISGDLKIQIVIIAEGVVHHINITFYLLQLAVGCINKSLASKRLTSLQIVMSKRFLLHIVTFLKSRGNLALFQASFSVLNGSTSSISVNIENWIFKTRTLQERSLRIWVLQWTTSWELHHESPFCAWTSMPLYITMSFQLSLMSNYYGVVIG